MTPGPHDRERAIERARLAALREALTESSARLREDLARSAAAIAETEETLADAFELMAQNRPRHAERLGEKAKAAREYAAIERDRSKQYRSG